MERVSNGINDSARLARTFHGIILGACVVVLGLSLLLQVGDSHVELFGWTCPMRCFVYQVFGVRCAFCGMTRSFALTAHGDFREALQQHALGPVLFGYLVLQGIYRAIALLGVHGHGMKHLGRAGWVLGAVILGAIMINWFVYLGGQWA